MTHHHLRFKILNGVKCNTNHNEYRSTAEGNIHSANRTDDYGEDCDNAEE